MGISRSICAGATRWSSRRCPKRPKARSGLAPRDDRRRAFRHPFRACAIRDHIRRTPILETASPVAGAPPLSLKLECLQATGSFKARGAFHNLLTRPASGQGAPPPLAAITARPSPSPPTSLTSRRVSSCRKRRRARRSPRSRPPAPRPSSAARPMRWLRSAATLMCRRAARSDPSLRCGRDGRRPGDGRARVGGGSRASRTRAA